MSKYNFTITLRPWGDNPETGTVRIDPAALYGYWEHRDGTEGGGLWFEKTGDGLELIDFDGDYFMPLKVVTAIRAAGVTVAPEFNP